MNFQVWSPGGLDILAPCLYARFWLRVGEAGMAPAPQTSILGRFGPAAAPPPSLAGHLSSVIMVPPPQPVTESAAGALRHVAPPAFRREVQLYRK